MISAVAKIAGVIGWPVSHSLSPRLHNYWLREHHIDGAYIPLAVTPDDLHDVIRTLPKLGFRGVNLTIPHKEAVVPMLDAVEPIAARIGAVNTIVIEQGKLIGTNTDAEGFINNLKAGSDLSHYFASALVVGAGGASRAIIVALMDAGVKKITLTNRTEQNAQRLAETFGTAITVLPWERRHDALSEMSLLVNTTNQGMAGQPALDLKLDALPSSALVTDLVYTPLITPLLADAKSRGNTVVDGLGMLLHQARPGFARWFGVMPEITGALRTEIML